MSNRSILERSSLRSNRMILAGIPIALALAMSARAAFAVETWNGTTTDWNTAANWNPAIIPNSIATPVTFADASAGAVNISSSVSAQSITFSNLLNSYTLTSSASQTLTVASGISVAAGVTGTETINLASVSSGSLLFPSGNLLALTNNSTSGGVLSIGPNTTIGTPGTGGVTFNGPGSIKFSGSFAASPNNVVGGLTKFGPGTLDYIGNGTNLGGSIILNGGTLVLDYSASIATKIGAGMILDGGTLQFVVNPGSTFTQSLPSGLNVNAGATDMFATNLIASSITLNAGNISRSTSATVDFTPSSSFSIQTSTTNTNGLLGTGPAFATLNGGTNWAVQSGVVVAGLAGFSVNIYTSGANTDVTANSNPATFTTNSLRFNTGNQVLTLSGTNTLQSGGILVTPSATSATIAGGSLTAPSSGELIFHVYAVAGLAVNSALISSTGLTKTGTGTLLLGGTNTALTGPININRGGLDVLLPAAVNSASAINFNDDRAAAGPQKFAFDLGNGVNGTISPSIRLSAFSSNDYGTYFTTGASNNSTITLSGVISSAAGLTTPIRFTNSVSDTNGFNLTNANTFTGNISLFQGFLGITSDASLGNALNTLFLEVGDIINGGLVFLNTGVNVARPVALSFNTRVVSNGADSNTISGPISGFGALIKAGTGTLNLTNSANSFSGGVTVSAGTLSLGSTGSLFPGTNMTVSAGATFNPGTTSSVSLANLTLFGGTFRASTGSGAVSVNQIATGPSGGTIDLTGATTYAINLVNTGAAITVNGTSTWLSPANNGAILNNSGAISPVTIAPSVTLTNGIALGGAAGFRVTGGGTLFQNSDATNVFQMTAPITVGAATQFRVTDASTNSVGNLGAGIFTLDGGTFSYGGVTATTAKPISLTSNGGTIQIESAATTLLATGIIAAPGTLTKTGPGTLILTNASNSFTTLNIISGSVISPNDLSLGTGPVNISTAGTLLYNLTTSATRTFNLNSGTLQIAGGSSLTLNGAAVNGGFMRGAGTFILTGGASLLGVTTFNSTTITQNGPAFLTNFTNGGTINNNANLTFNGGTNTSIGIINVNNTLNTQDFLSDGVINVAVGGVINNSVSNFGLGGGARMFIGTKANPGGTLTLLGGTTLEVNGALLVNDGTISGTTDVNYGGTAQGIGTYGPVNVSFGGTFQPGFASSAFPGNSASVSQLSGNGTIDNTSTGNMTLNLTGNASSNFSGPIQNANGTTSLNITGTSSLTLSTTPLPAGGNSINSYTGGTTVANGASFIIAATGALPSGQPVTNNGNFTVNANSTAGKISGLGALTLGNNTFLKLANNAGGSKQGSLTLNPGAQLDLTNNQLVIEAPDALIKAADMTQLAAQVATGKNGGLWNGPGIISSTFPFTPQLSMAIIDNAVLATPFTTFGGQPVDANSILVAPELLGDSNIDGHVDLTDLSTILNNFGTTTGAWTSGNFDGQPAIDLTDLSDVLNNFGLTNPNASTSGLQITDYGLPTSTPEPASLALLLLAPALMNIMRHRI